MNLGALVADGSLLIAIPIAVLAGAISFLSPCVLPLVPGYLGFIGGAVSPRPAPVGTDAAAAGSSKVRGVSSRSFLARSTTATDVGAPATETKRAEPADVIEPGRGRLVLGVLLFIAGFTVVFVSMAMLGGTLGRFLFEYADPESNAIVRMTARVGPMQGAQPMPSAMPSSGAPISPRLPRTCGRVMRCAMPNQPMNTSPIAMMTTPRIRVMRSAYSNRNRPSVPPSIAGFTVVFVSIAMLGGTLGRFLVEYSEVITRILGVVIIAMGLVFIGWFGMAQRITRPQVRGNLGLIGAPLLGIALGIGWAPCIGPTLAVILTMAFDSGSAARAALLGVAYSLGLGIPFLLLTLGFGWATRSVSFVRRHIRAVNVIGGVLLIVLGLLMVTGVWTAVMAQLQGVFASVPAPL